MMNDELNIMMNYDELSIKYKVYIKIYIYINIDF